MQQGNTRPPFRIETKYQKINAYGEPVESAKDASCLSLEFKTDVDEETKHCAYLMIDKRLHQTIISAEEHLPNPDPKHFPPIGKYVGTATEEKEDMLEISKALHEFLKDYDQAIQELE